VLENKGLKVRATDKMVVGFGLTAATMGIMSVAAALAGQKEEAVRVVVKEGDVRFSAGHVVFNESMVEVRDGELTQDKEGHYVLKGGLVSDGDRWVPLAESEKLWEGRSGEFKNGQFTFKKAQLFVSTGTVQALDGTAVVKGGKVEKAEGALKLDDGKVVKENGDKKETVLQPDEFARIENKVSVWWQVLAYLILTVAEVLISVTGLELAYAAAPKRMTSFLTACWLLTVSLANLLFNAPVARLYPLMEPSLYFGGLAVTLVVVGGAFVFVARNFNRVIADQTAKTAFLTGAADAPGAAPQGPASPGVTDPTKIQ